MRRIFLVPLMLAVVAASGCKTAKSAAEGAKSAASSVGSTATSLVNVNLSNVLNDLAIDLKIDKANIPINAQIPITIAANVCGVSINILSVGAGGGNANCTAKTSSPELAQAVQQQLAAGGNVGGGAQTTTTPTTTTTPPPTTTTTTPPPPEPTEPPQ